MIERAVAASRAMPRPEGVLMMRSKSFFARRHRRFVAISQGGLSTFRCDEHDIAILETRKDLPFEYVESMVLDGRRFEVRRLKPWRHAVTFYCESDDAARLWADAFQSRLDAFRAKARSQLRSAPDDFAVEGDEPPRPPGAPEAAVSPPKPPGTLA